jgi:hypothetical protein
MFLVETVRIREHSIEIRFINISEHFYVKLTSKSFYSYLPIFLTVVAALSVILMPGRPVDWCGIGFIFREQTSSGSVSKVSPVKSLQPLCDTTALCPCLHTYLNCVLPRINETIHGLSWMVSFSDQLLWAPSGPHTVRGPSDWALLWFISLSWRSFINKTDVLSTSSTL